jgi:hypothetical protein
LITRKKAIDSAEARLFAQLKKGGIRQEPHQFGTQGGKWKAPFYWFPKLSFWFAYGTERLTEGERVHAYWFGNGNPLKDAVSITVQANIPVGRARRMRLCGGAFVRDEDGKVFLVHRGTVRGRGFGKKSFLAEYGKYAPLKRIDDDEKSTEVIIIGAVGSKSFPRQVRKFVARAAKIKARLRKRRR